MKREDYALILEERKRLEEYEKEIFRKFHIVSSLFFSLLFSSLLINCFQDNCRIQEKGRRRIKRPNFERKGGDGGKISTFHYIPNP
jgi:hypothetical protein